MINSFIQLILLFIQLILFLILAQLFLILGKLFIFLVQSSVFSSVKTLIVIYFITEKPRPAYNDSNRRHGLI
ncbi:hypothetical protein Mp_7g03850 [Marchantia polymorpha subsp. ruderalis]|uniref:Uncharacterized protein n=2 Tax=Marchantia polymorpha TaxID=3197 RepID=A0AAF6BVW7_MARPO|nr:hypothetical protein MARPO_0074s0012 [Marchantia polymorpha]BBN16151.1 hypothetical protein Mp_7g03850 [Marchantia polymorpha subsp. ruderalis]|eukprot:PTQ35014.1 hypothetical protein MARPO_0074s0012 [Marchantia polymorpha]